MTEPLFRDDAYLTSAEANVIAINDRGGVILDRTLFYAASGGQPGDSGTFEAGSAKGSFATTVYDDDRSTIVHVPAEGTALPAVGETVKLSLDWNKRFAHMRIHTALHLLCSLIPYPVTGGQIGTGDGRLDFDLQGGDPLDKDALTERLNALIEADHAITTRWITDEELDAQPDLVRTMSVQPPRGSGRIRLVAIGDDGHIDLQPCGGTHVRSTKEIGALSVRKIENKGKQNRRVRIAFAA